MMWLSDQEHWQTTKDLISTMPIGLLFVLLCSKGKIMSWNQHSWTLWDNNLIMFYHMSTLQTILRGLRIWFYPSRQIESLNTIFSASYSSILLLEKLLTGSRNYHQGLLLPGQPSITHSWETSLMMLDLKTWRTKSLYSLNGLLNPSRVPGQDLDLNRWILHIMDSMKFICLDLVYQMALDTTSEENSTPRILRKL